MPLPHMLHRSKNFNCEGMSGSSGLWLDPLCVFWMDDQGKDAYLNDVVKWSEANKT